MNTPIINPLWIYFANILPKFGVTCLTIGIIGLCLFLIIAIALTVDVGWFDDDGCVKLRQIFKKYLYLPIILIFVGVFTPNEKTIYGMMAANYVTPANIQSVGNNAKEVVDYIFEKINESEDKNE